MAYDAVGIFECACELIDGNLRLSLNELSRHVGIHRHTLESIIVRQSNCTFEEWRRERRMRKAQALLLDPSLLLKEVAFAVGLTPPRLTTLFRRQVQATPTAYRLASCQVSRVEAVATDGCEAADLDVRAIKRTRRQSKALVTRRRPR